ncbi:hypothetical protein [Nocardia sp. NPDC048505]|uniref:hypothetical protein n=1 Tax=unclassified Nocardia TaxID=2637762 RepID=UPI0033C9F8DA
MSEETSPGEVPDWIRALGFVDIETGRERARSSRHRIESAVRHGIGHDQSARDISAEHMHALVVFTGLVTRANGLHDGAVAALESDNPYAAFTLLRSYAENAAAIGYLLDRPAAMNRFWSSERPISIGKIVSHASQPSSRFGNFKHIYGELSQFSHPAGLSITHSSVMSGDDWQWSSMPRFKSTDDYLAACGWVIELADAHHHLLRHFAEDFLDASPDGGE